MDSVQRKLKILNDFDSAPAPEDPSLFEPISCWQIRQALYDLSDRIDKTRIRSERFVLASQLIGAAEALAWWARGAQIYQYYDRRYNRLWFARGLELRPEVAREERLREESRRELPPNCPPVTS